MGEPVGKHSPLEGQHSRAHGTDLPFNREIFTRRNIHLFSFSLLWHTRSVVLLINFLILKKFTFYILGYRRALLMTKNFLIYNIYT